MSQLLFGGSGGGGAIITQLTTDSGIATPTAGNINLFGDGSNMTTSGSGSTVTVTLEQSLTITSIEFPNTATSGVAAINFNGIPYLHNYSNGGFGNIFLGQNAGGNFFSSGQECTGIGINALKNVSSSINMTAVGANALSSANSVSDCTAVGVGALQNLSNGDFNCAFGEMAGNSYSSGTASNIVIGYNCTGSGSDNNTLRIGNATGTGAGNLNAAFISGIRGITTGSADAIAVLIDSNGQLGTVSSSLKTKKNIQDMGDQSSNILKLRPVSFEFKNAKDDKTNFGLIAEEVKEVFPYLLATDAQGEPMSVKYHELPALLLNEVIKLRRELDEMKGAKNV